MASESAAASSDFFELLVQDHGRIESKLRELDGALSTLSRVEDDARAREILAETLRFFDTEGAVHEGHEELTLFPRLKPLAEFGQILSALEFQHRMNATEARALAACLARAAPGDGRELRRLAGRFADANRGHMIAEERALFPLAKAKLAPQELAAMSRERSDRLRSVGKVR